MSLPYLHQYFPEIIETVPHISLGAQPTPVRKLKQLSFSGVELWLKDESVFGDGGWGGNKVRKLEWLIPEAKRRNSKTILTFGGLGTNWGLATALYAREHGLHTTLALIDQPIDEHVQAQLQRLRTSGASLHFTHSKIRTMLLAPWLLARNLKGGKLPYILPAGGSSSIGVLGYVETALEIAEQVRTEMLPAPSHVVCAVGTGGTLAGLTLGFRLAGLKTQVLGVVVNETLPLDAATIAKLGQKSADFLHSRGAKFDIQPLTAADIHVRTDWLGEGYGYALPGSTSLLEAAFVKENLVLDPIYTGKAMAGVIELLSSGGLGDGPVLFIQSNGPR